VTVVADTGAIYALLDRDDAWHDRVRGWWEEYGGEAGVVLPVTTLPEICWLLSSRISPRAELAFVEAVAEGEFATEPLLEEDLARTADVVRTYADSALGFVDGSITAIAERLGTRRLLTTDRRHFGMLRLAKGAAFQLLP
jgi:predicted nucleic acid-binding protein